MNDWDLPVTLDADQLASFETSGYLPLGRLMSATQLAGLQHRADDLTQGRGARGRVQFQLDEQWRGPGGDGRGVGYVGPSDGYRKISPLEWDDVFYPFIASAAARSVVAHLVSGPLRVHRSMVLMKPARGGAPLPWHQDAGQGFPEPGTPYCTIWTALDDAAADNGAMYILPGSQEEAVDGLPWPEVVARASRKAGGREEERVLSRAAAGESYLLNPLVMHGSEANPTDRPRRALNVIYMPADARLQGANEQEGVERRLISDAVAT